MIQCIRGLRASSETRELIIALGNGVGGSVVSRPHGCSSAFPKMRKKGFVIDGTFGLSFD
jgi:hypothetical protein